MDVSSDRRWWYRSMTLLLLLAILAGPLFGALPAGAQDNPPPELVVVPGTLQSKAGCAGDWQPDCDKTALIYDEEDGIWEAEFSLPVGNYEYKVALNGSWNENYGLNAAAGGSNIPLAVTAPAKVKFYYDHATHWVADSINARIITVVGDFQSELGCGKDNDAGCMRSWLQDPGGSGTYVMTTKSIPPGSYTAQLAFNEDGTALYGQGGKKGGDPYAFTVENEGAEVYFGYNSATGELVIGTSGAPKGDLTKARAHWVRRDTLLWPGVGSADYEYRLHYDPTGAMELGLEGITGGEALELTFDEAGPGDELMAEYPHLATAAALRIGTGDFDKLPDILRGQIAISAWDKDGKLVDASSIQIPGVLDDLYFYDGPLGVTYDGDVPTLRVWAPTARNVNLQLFDDANAAEAGSVEPMTLDPKTGVWSVTGPADWNYKYYLYEVEVFVPATGKVEKNLVTDPYSFSLAMNSKRSQIIDL